MRQRKKPCVMKLHISGTKLFSVKTTLLKYISVQKPAKQLVWTDSLSVGYNKSNESKFSAFG